VSVVDTETLRLLLTQRILVSDEMGELEEDLEASSRKYLSHVAELGKKQEVAVETILRRGAFHSVILAEQKTRDSDLIVMGPIQYSLTRRDLVVRERHLIADEAACPVLLVR
jgi:nucleotide-binding universal stress UspA family protein